MDFFNRWHSSEREIRRETDPAPQIMASRSPASVISTVDLTSRRFLPEESDAHLPSPSHLLLHEFLFLFLASPPRHGPQGTAPVGIWMDTPV
jgi:hypothetical protein